MNDFFKIAKDLEHLLKDQKRIYAETINENEFVLSDGIADQMNKGITGFGTPITPDYSFGYAAFKGFSTPNLRLEGDFHKSIFVKADLEGVTIDATDEKKDTLLAKYGEEVLIPTQQSIDEFNQLLVPEMQAKNKKAMIRWI